MDLASEGNDGLSDCIFCKIARKEAPASVIYEDDEVMAFLDVNPLQRGHTLVIPKRHFVDIWDIDSAVLTKVVAVTKQVAKKMAVTLNAEGINTFSASGKPAGQAIYHFHMHVIPLGKGERSKFSDWWSLKISRAERSELDKLAQKLRL
jgi:histidine triad (HIT) family protein